MKVEKALNEEKDETDKRFDSAIGRFDNIDTLVEEHTDAIDVIKNKADEVTRKLNTVNETLKIIDAEIKVLESQIEHEEVIDAVEDISDDNVKHDKNYS